MAVVQSEVHENLNRDKILGDTWFCYYCLCGGMGIGPVMDPLLGSESKMLCLRSICTTADLIAEDGLCGGMSVMCCLTQHFQLPPTKGAPVCVCFNKPLKPGEGTVNYKDALFDYGTIFGDTWWLCYAFCFGLGFSGLQSGGRPLYATSEKFLIARSQVKLEEPVKDGVFCSGVGTECCFWSQMELPPAGNNPVIGCCGWRKNKSSGGPASIGDAIGKPTKVVEMK